MTRICFPRFAKNLRDRSQKRRGNCPITSGEGKTSSDVPIEFPVEVDDKSYAAADQVRLTWLSGAASTAGTSHIARGSGCDDWYEVRGGNGALVIVVADGMGSAQFGAVGARVAVKAATRSLLRSRFAGKTDKQLQTLIREAIGQAQEAVEAAARELSCEGRDLATTLVCVAATKRFVAIGQVGDCSCIVLSAEGDALTLTARMKGEYANETYAVGVHEEVLRSSVYRGAVRGVAVFTDGLERIAMDRDRPYLPFLEPLWQFVLARDKTADAEFNELLTSERVRRATDDDCTLVVGVLAPAKEVEDGPT